METCKHGIFGQCSYCWAEAEKEKETRLEALEKWGREVINRVVIEDIIDDIPGASRWYCQLCGNHWGKDKNPLHYDDCPMTQSRTLGLVKE